MSNRKNIIKKLKARARKTERTPGQMDKDAKVHACGRKIPYFTQQEADEVANRMGHLTYACSYGTHFHAAHLPGSRRFVRGKAA